MRTARAQSDVAAPPAVPPDGVLNEVRYLSPTPSPTEPLGNALVSSSARRAPRVGVARTRGLLRVGLGMAVGLSGLAMFVIGGRAWLGGAGTAPSVMVGEQGLTQVTTTRHFIVVLNVVPPERMLTAQEAQHGGAGQDAELIIAGSQGQIGPRSRHTEVHVYDRRTGAAVSDAAVRMTLHDLSAGTTTDIPSTTMEDLVLGPIDVHYGNNTDLPTGHRFLLTAQIDEDQVTFSGILR